MTSIYMGRRDTSQYPGSWSDVITYTGEPVRRRNVDDRPR